MSVRKSTPRGQMTRGANSGPAIMLMPPHIRATFMPNPPLQQVPIAQKRRKKVWTGVADYMVEFEKKKNAAATKTGSENKGEDEQDENQTNINDNTRKDKTVPTPKSLREEKQRRKLEAHKKELEPAIEAYRAQQREQGGEYEGMNCYNTLFVARLAYECSERKLLREMEVFGPIKDLKIITDKKTGQSRGYGFVEYEHEEDMKRAWRAADGMRIEGREIVVDVERGHTVPNWLPRRLGGGLGGTRLGGKEINVTRPGRFDPDRPDIHPVPAIHMGGPPPPPAVGMGRGGGGPPMQQYGGGFGGGGMGRGSGGPPPPPHFARGRPGGGGGDRYGGGSSAGGRDWDRGGGGPSPSGRYGGDRGPGGGGGDYRKRHRSPSPGDRRYQERRRRY